MVLTRLFFFVTGLQKINTRQAQPTGVCFSHGLSFCIAAVDSREKHSCGVIKEYGELKI